MLVFFLCLALVQSTLVTIQPIQTFQHELDLNHIHVQSLSIHSFATSDDWHKIVIQLQAARDLAGERLGYARFQLHVHDHNAQLRLMDLVVDILPGQKARFNAKTCTLEAHIPRQQECHETCARTGTRKFGICGQRSRECSTHCQVRPLNSYELESAFTTMWQHVVDHSIMAQLTA